MLNTGIGKAFLSSRNFCLEKTEKANKQIEQKEEEFDAETQGIPQEKEKKKSAHEILPRSFIFKFTVFIAWKRS